MTARLSRLSRDGDRTFPAPDIARPVGQRCQIRLRHWQQSSQSITNANFVFFPRESQGIPREGNFAGELGLCSRAVLAAAIGHWGGKVTYPGSLKKLSPVSHHIIDRSDFETKVSVLLRPVGQLWVETECTTSKVIYFQGCLVAPLSDLLTCNCFCNWFCISLLENVDRVVKSLLEAGLILSYYDNTVNWDT